MRGPVKKEKEQESCGGKIKKQVQQMAKDRFQVRSQQGIDCRGLPDRFILEMMNDKVVIVDGNERLIRYCKLQKAKGKNRKCGCFDQSKQSCLSKQKKQNTASPFGNIQSQIFSQNQPSLAKKAFFSSSFTSAENSLIATDEHLLCFVTFLFLSYLHIPSHSPKVSPCSTSTNGILFWAASPLMILTQLASLQFLARTTYLALSFSSLVSMALQTSWIPLAKSESLLEV